MPKYGVLLETVILPSKYKLNQIQLRMHQYLDAITLGELRCTSSTFHCDVPWIFAIHAYMVSKKMCGKAILRTTVDWLSSPGTLELVLSGDIVNSAGAIVETNAVRAGRVAVALQQGETVQPDFVIQPF